MGMEGAKQRVPSTELYEHDMLSNCKEMSSLLSNICVEVKAAQGKAADALLHNIKPGDLWSDKRIMKIWQFLFFVFNINKI